MRRTKDSPSVADGNIAIAPVDESLYLRVQGFGADASLVKGASLSNADKTAGSQVDAWHYQPQLIYIRNYSLAAGDGIPALCRKTLTTSAATLALDSSECLVEGIENLQIEFGLDNSVPIDFVPDYYEKAPTAAELERAVTARIYLLARSLAPMPGYSNDKSYNLGAITIAALDDGYYRRVLQTTVMLRNSEAFGF